MGQSTPERIVKTALPATVDAGTRVLLLGTLPGERSLAAAEYYAHPSNAFWWLIGEILNEPSLPAMPYAGKLERLRVRGIGLWDVIGSARREGSLDSAIRDATHRDLVAFATGLPELRAICFNGGEAARRGRRQLAGHTERWALIDLPSSSGAHARTPRPAKLDAWKAIRKYLP